MKASTLSRLFVVLSVLCSFGLLCGCEQTKGNTPDSKDATIAPNSSMEAYKTGNPAKAAASKP